MSTRAEMIERLDKQDAQTLEDAVRVIKRRRIIFGGSSRAGVCSELLATAYVLRHPAQATPKETQ